MLMVEATKAEISCLMFPPEQVLSVGHLQVSHQNIHLTPINSLLHEEGVHLFLYGFVGHIW